VRSAVVKADEALDGVHSSSGIDELIGRLLDVLARLRDQVSDIDGDASDREAVLQAVAAVEDAARRAQARLQASAGGAAQPG
jgi:hypothetical protein